MDRLGRQPNRHRHRPSPKSRSISSSVFLFKTRQSVPHAFEGIPFRRRGGRGGGDSIFDSAHSNPAKFPPRKAILCGRNPFVGAILTSSLVFCRVHVRRRGGYDPLIETRLWSQQFISVNAPMGAYLLIYDRFFCSSMGSNRFHATDFAFLL